MPKTTSKPARPFAELFALIERGAGRLAIYCPVCDKLVGVLHPASPVYDRVLVDKLRLHLREKHGE